MNIEFYKLFRDSEESYRLIVTTREKTLVCTLRRTSKGYQLTPEAEINFELGPRGCLYSAIRLTKNTVLVAADSSLYRLDLNPIQFNPFKLDIGPLSPIISLNKILENGRPVAVVTTFDNNLLLVDCTHGHILSKIKLTLAANCMGLVNISGSGVILIGLGNLNTRALTDTKCILFGIDLAKILK